MAHGSRALRPRFVQPLRQDFRDDDGYEDKHETDDDARDERFGPQRDAESHPEDSLEGKK